MEIFGLLETKVRRINFQHHSRTFGTHISVISNGNEEGHHKPDRIWLCWDTRLWEVESVKTHPQYIHCRAKNRGGFDINLTVVYGSSNPNKRRGLWEEINLLSININKPWLILGDFNEVRRREERIGPKARICLANLEAFNNYIEDSSLNELDPIDWGRDFLA